MSPAMFLKPRHASELNACWNSVYRRIFKFHKWESVRQFVCGLGRLDLHHIVQVRRVKYYKRLLQCNNTLLTDIFWIHFTNSFKSDSCCVVLYATGLHAAIQQICNDFSASAAL